MPNLPIFNWFKKNKKETKPTSAPMKTPKSDKHFVYLNNNQPLVEQIKPTKRRSVQYKPWIEKKITLAECKAISRYCRPKGINKAEFLDIVDPKNKRKTKDDYNTILRIMTKFIYQHRFIIF